MTPTLALIFDICIIPLLGILTTYIVALIRNKIAEINNKTENETAQKYLTMLSETVISCVIATNQTYVESLKKQNKFDLEAQKKAFELTKDAVLEILSHEAIEYLNTIIGDLNTYIDNLIEATVNYKKYNN